MNVYERDFALIDACWMAGNDIKRSLFVYIRKMFREEPERKKRLQFNRNSGDLYKNILINISIKLE